VNVQGLLRLLQVWRLLTPMFLHAGFVHLATNLVMQLRLAIFLVTAARRVH
jgi:membrane associated rhomboid family serine protease